MSYKSLGRRKGLKTKFLCLLTVLTVMIGSMPMTALGLTQAEADQKWAEYDQKIADFRVQYNQELQNEKDAQKQLSLIEEGIQAFEEQQALINDQIAQ